MSVFAELHDGRRLEFPDGTDPTVIQTTVKKVLGVGAVSEAPKAEATPVADYIRQSLQPYKQAGLAVAEHAANIGATILQPFQAALDPAGTNQLMRAGIKGGANELGVDRNSPVYQGAGLLTDIAGTAGAGGFLGKGVSALAPAVSRFAPAVAEYVPQVASALRTSGFTTGAPAATNALGKVTDMGIRMAGGYGAGRAQMELIDHEHAGTAGIIGAALPPTLKGLGAVAAPVGKAIGQTITGGAIAPEVQDLARLAKDKWKIDIPADRIANSKPLNAVAAGLNYVPFSGRQAVEDRMVKQLDTALSTTFGQNSPNVTMALRKAQGELGAKFDTVLKSNTVKVDEPMLTGMAAVEEKANRELGADGMKAIKGQIDEILSKGASGQIDGQAAYNIKRDLDRIGQRSTPEAFHARELKKELMGALDRSLGPEAAAAFKKTRQEYGNMLDLEGLAQNGAEGGISVARLANMKNIGNPDMQELADIAAQFVKTRESAHGAAQRATAGLGVSGLGFGIGGPVGSAIGLGGAALAGRGANALLDSAVMRNALLSKPGELSAAAQELNRLAGPGAYRAAPRFGQR